MRLPACGQPLIKIILKGNALMKKCTLSLLVDNTSGVLSRVAGLFSRRGYNIDSLTVGETKDPRFSRMTIVVSGEDNVIEQICKQVAKLEDVRTVKTLDPDKSVQRELILIKIKITPEKRQEVISVANIFRASIVDVGDESLTIEAIGSQNKLDAIIRLMEPYNIVELARTGVTGLSRGVEDVTYL